VALRAYLIWFVLQVFNSTVDNMSMQIKDRRKETGSFAAVQTFSSVLEGLKAHHDFVMKQGLKFHLKRLRLWMKIVN